LRKEFDWSAESNQNEALFGNMARGIGDTNGDGFDDLLIAARSLDHGEINEGLVAVYYGSPSGLSRWPNWTDEGNELGAQLGEIVAALGDINGDGVNEFAAGSFFHRRGGQRVGEIRIYFGRRGGLVGSSGWTPRLSFFESVARKLDLIVAKAGWRLLLAAILGFAALVLWVAAARRAARAQVADIRGRLHDFLGPELAGNEPHERRSNRILEELRGVIWNVKQDAPTVASLIRFVADWVSSYARSNDLVPRLELPNSVRNVKLTTEQVEIVQAIVRIALCNVIEHAAARMVRLRIAVDDSEMRVEIEDDGRGFDVAETEKRIRTEGGHAGLSNMRTRVAKLGGSFEIESTPDRGTHVSASIPLTREIRTRPRMAALRF
jgi:anti-sigma regulatory factor (Ser/Thr protein kinase)